MDVTVNPAGWIATLLQDGHFHYSEPAPPGGQERAAWAEHARYTPADQVTVGLRTRKGAKYAAFLAGRLWRHTRLLVPTLWGLLTWKRGR